ADSTCMPPSLHESALRCCHRFVLAPGSLALTLSAAVVAALILVQGIFLFPQHVAKELAPPPTVLHEFSLGNGDRAALALLSVPPGMEGAQPRNVIAVATLAMHPPQFHRLEIGLALRSIVAARGSPHAFLNTPNGDLYSLNLDAPRDPI